MSERNEPDQTQAPINVTTIIIEQNLASKSNKRIVGLIAVLFLKPRGRSHVTAYRTPKYSLSKIGYNYV